MLEWVIYEHAQALQPFNVEQEPGGRRSAALEGGKPLENGEQTWRLVLMKSIGSMQMVKMADGSGGRATRSKHAPQMRQSVRESPTSFDSRSIDAAPELVATVLVPALYRSLARALSSETSSLATYWINWLISVFPKREM